MIIFLRHWVHTCPTAKYLVIHSCAVVVEAQTMHEIQLLAIELVALKTGDLIAMVVLTESVAKGVIVIYLQPINAWSLLHHHMAASQVAFLHAAPSQRTVLVQKNVNHKHMHTIIQWTLVRAFVIIYFQLF